MKSFLMDNEFACLFKLFSLRILNYDFYIIILLLRAKASNAICLRLKLCKNLFFDFDTLKFLVVFKFLLRKIVFILNLH